MATRISLLLVTLFVLGFAVAGCGDDDDGGDSGSGGDTSSQESTKDDSAGGDDAAPGLDGEAAQQAAEDCKQSVNAQSQLSDDVKGDLEQICEDAADGDEDAVREASKDVCVKIVEESAPAGATRDQAIKACEEAEPTP